MSIVRKEAIIALTPAADHSEKEGYFINLTAGVPVVCSAVTDVPFGVLIDGEEANGVDSVGVCGGNLPTILVKLSGSVSKGQTLQLHSDGSCVVDAGSGARVVVAQALEDGVSGDLIEAVILTPVKYS
jgi:hypothetical protein